MLTESFINQVRDVPIQDIIGRFVQLKKAGSGLIASCPFHGEKTASFRVTPAKNIYKCFGCGAAGDGVQFIIEHERQTFAEACKTIAGIAGIQVEEEQRSNDVRYKEILEAAEAQEKALNIVVPLYRQQLHQLPDDHPAKKWLSDRRITPEIADEWQLGWAPDDWRFVAPRLVEDNLHTAATSLGLIKRNQSGDNYDGYRSRIIFPITDRNGRYIGLGGRYIKLSDTDAKDIPKYINPAQCELYNKSAVLYGLKQAAAAIRQHKRVYVTEGYMDALSPSRAGIQNVVATCGTALTVEQVKLLRRHTSNIILWRDNDKAGINATMTHLPLLLQHGCVVHVAQYDGKDPDEWVQQQPLLVGGQQIADHHEPVEGPPVMDAIFWYTEQRLDDADAVHEKAAVKADVLALVAKIPDEILRDTYFDNLVKRHKWKAVETRRSFNTIVERQQETSEAEEPETSGFKFPHWVTEDQREKFLTQGFISLNQRNKDGNPVVGYYTFSSEGKKEITNFIVTPLFHIYAGLESRFMIQVYNGYRRSVIDLPAKVIVSPDQFQAYTVTESNFVIFGSKPQWLRIASELLQQFPRCIELQHLGWQSFGFYAFVNKIFIPGIGLVDPDQWGIVQHTVIASEAKQSAPENFLIPASCEAYKQLQRTGDDPYENDRVFELVNTSVSFEDWALQMQKVYGQKGVVGIASVILALFRDIIFKIDNNCPHVYAFGEPSSGKSKWAESCTAVFFQRRSAFNLNSGTDFAFFNFMQRFKNTIAHLNEFDIDVIKPEWFQSIKGIYDGEGRERGSMKAGGRNRTEIMRVHSVLMLTGQKLVIADDNSVVTRSIIEPFSIVEDRTDENKRDYDTLKRWESEGLSSLLIDLLRLRPLFEKTYQERFNHIINNWRRHRKEARGLNQRILQNYAHMATGYAIAGDILAMPQHPEDYEDYCYRQAVRWSQFIRSSDTLSEFWRTFEFFVSEQAVELDWDFAVVTEMSTRIRKNRAEEISIDHTEPTRVLYLRLNTVHKKFETAFRNRTGQQAMSLDNLLHYFSSRKYYLGPVKQRQFRRWITETTQVNGIVGTNRREQQQTTSCYAFLLDELDIAVDADDGSAPEDYRPVVDEIIM